MFVLDYEDLSPGNPLQVTPTTSSLNLEFLLGSNPTVSRPSRPREGDLEGLLRSKGGEMQSKD